MAGNKNGLRDSKGKFIKYLKVPYCIDCQKELSSKNKPQRCHSCSNKFLIKKGIIGMAGRKQSTYQKKRMSEVRKGQKASEETKYKIRNNLCVHHINGNHQDNRPENRRSMTRSEHARLHIYQGDITFFGRNNLKGGK